MRENFRFFLGLAISVFVAGGLRAGPFDFAVLHGETDKSCAVAYLPDERMLFTISLQGAGQFGAGEYFVRWTRTGDDGKVDGGRVDAMTLPLVVETSLGQAGFVRIQAVVEDVKGRVCKRRGNRKDETPERKTALNIAECGDDRVFFDGGAGVKIETLQSMSEPEDFDEFWRRRKERLGKVPIKADVIEHETDNPAIRIVTFSVKCAGPRPVTGWATVPVDKSRKFPAEIMFHGYGAHYVQPIPRNGSTEKIDMYINAHGYELGREPEYYTEFYSSIMSNGMTFGLDSEWQNQSTETAYFGWMIYRITRALQYLKTFPEWNGRNLIASGSSMGGMQAIWAAGIDCDVSEVRLAIPWCCDMGGRKSKGRIIPQWGVNETVAMRYFDPVNFAKRVNPNCRVEILRAGLGDYDCPPSGIAILYNNLRCSKKILWVQGSTHGFVPPEEHQQFSFESGGALGL